MTIHCRESGDRNIAFFEVAADGSWISTDIDIPSGTRDMAVLGRLASGSGTVFDPEQGSQVGALQPANQA